MPTVLQLLSQRPTLTGSGVTLDALAHEVTLAGWNQHVIVATAHDELQPAVDGLPDERIHALKFGSDLLPFAIPGMSDVMPYASTVFGAMSDADWERYREAWRSHLESVVEKTRPDVIHSHHVWLLSGLVKDVAPDVPLVVHCHSTGLRQLARANPDRAQHVREGCRRADAFAVLHEDHQDALVDALGVTRDRVHVVGAGYSAEWFHTRGRDPEPRSILFAGKLAMAKGLPSLLDAFERLSRRRSDIRLHIAGDGYGEEGDRIRDRIEGLAPQVVYHGRLDQRALADRMRRSAAFVLPSFYEGLPLVLVEARACGCQLVATALPGVESLAGPLADGLELVDLPRLDVDRPDPDDLPAFTARLEHALERAVDVRPATPEPASLEPFRWRQVFARVESVWNEVLNGQAR